MEVERPAVELGRRQGRTPAIGPAIVGRSRCPFCHDAIGLETTDWVACQRCLARHHDGCWEETSGCSSCGATRALAKQGLPPRRRWFVVPAALLVGAAIGLAAGAVAGLRVPTVTRAEPTTPTPAVVAAAPVEPVTRQVYVPDHVWERLSFLVNEGRYDDAERFIDDHVRQHPEVAAELRDLLRRGVDAASHDAQHRQTRGGGPRLDLRGVGR